MLARGERPRLLTVDEIAAEATPSTKVRVLGVM